ncbi:MAG: T9SS type A sorting domain-containing protein [Saprospiraceae bacterium]
MRAVKILSLWIPLLLGVSILFAQKEDYNWILGYNDPGPIDTLFGKTVINFKNKIIDIKKYNTGKIHPFSYTSAAISDTSGDLLFYTKGISVFNKDGNVMPNGGIICPGEVAKLNVKYGLAVTQGALILPWPNHPKKYFILHKILQATTIYYSDTLYATLVDMEMSNGLGDVSEAHKVVHIDTMLHECLTSCKHANGRDWWILIPKFNTKLVFRYLLDPSGIRYIGKQETDYDFIDGIGQATFSPNGKLFAIKTIIDKDASHNLHLFNFDRCNGLLSKHAFWNNIGSISFTGAGIAFSPSSRFLYSTHRDIVWQLDLNDKDPVATRQVILVSDKFGVPYEFNYDVMQTAPDGKIYFVSSNGANYINVIHEPDKKGMACRPEPHAYMITYNVSMVNNPYYRLGKETNSICDTIISNVNYEKKIFSEDFYIYPNPTYESIHIYIPKDYYLSEINYEVISMQGKVLIKKTNHPSNDIVIKDINPGIYLIKVYNNKSLVLTDKFIINSQ